MAQETEIDRLVVRIVGDNDDYVKKMEQNAKVAEKTAEQIVNSLDKVEKAQENLRSNADLDEMFGGASKAPDPVVGIEKRIQRWAAARDGMTEQVQQAIAQQNAAEARYTKEAESRDKERAQVEVQLVKERQAVQDKYSEAIARHSAEEARFAKEAISRDRERVAVAKQLDKERSAAANRMREERIEREKLNELDRKQSLGAIMGMRGGSGSVPTGNVDFDKPAKSAIGFRDALTALASVTGILHAAQTAMQNDMDKLNDSLREGAALNAKLSEERAYHSRQNDEKYGSLPAKARIDLQKEELASLQKIVETQKNKYEADKKAVEDARGPMFVGSALRSLPGIGAGKQADLEASEKNAEKSNETLEQTRARIKELQRELSEVSEGGDRAEQAMNRFRIQMERQTQSVIEGRKAVILFNLEQQNLSEKQKAEAEAIYKREKAKQDAFHESQRITDEYFQREIEAFDKVKHTTDQFMSPMEAYMKRKEELDEQLGDGLSQETYNRALDDAKTKFDRATTSAQKFHNQIGSGNATLFGSVEAQLKTTAQVEMLNKPPSSTATGPKGPKDDEMTNYLRTIAENTKKGALNTTPIQPANI